MVVQAFIDVNFKSLSMLLCGTYRSSDILPLAEQPRVCLIRREVV